MRASPHIHAIHGERLSVCSSLLLRSDSVCLSFSFLFSSLFYLFSDLNSFFHVDNAKANNPCASANRGILPLGRIHSSHKVQGLRSTHGTDERHNIRKEQGRANTYILKMQRTRQNNTLHPKVQQRLEWLSEHHEEYFSKTELIIFFFFLVVDAKLVSRRSMARHSVGISPMA